jgi:hypothetical protein
MEQRQEMKSSTIVDAAAELELRYKEAAATDRDLRKLQLEIDQTQIKINEIWERANLAVGAIRINEHTALKQKFSREKWLRANVAHQLRNELGIATIPGYESPIDKIREQRRIRKKKERAKLKQNATVTHEQEVGQTVCNP